ALSASGGFLPGWCRRGSSANAAVRLRRIRISSHPTDTHKSVTVSHVKRGAAIPNAFVPAADGVDTTMPAELLIEACINIVMKRLPFVRQYSHAIATETAVTAAA